MQDDTEQKLARYAAMGPEEILVCERQFAESGVDRESMRRIADLALMPPVINTNPGPEYSYARQDYGMTIGIERTPGGRLWAVWVGGEDGPASYMLAATSEDDGESWSPHPRLAVDRLAPHLPFPRSVIVGFMWTDPLGRLWFFFDQTMNHYDGRHGLWAARCDNPDDDDPVWTNPRRLWHGVSLNKPTVLTSGEWMLPVYLLEHTKGKEPFTDLFPELDPLRGGHAFVCTDQGATWERRGLVKFPQPNWHETIFLERRDGTVSMLARTLAGCIMESRTSDKGFTWSDPRPLPGVAHPPSRFQLRRLASGRLLLVKHGRTVDGFEPEHRGRTHLSAWLSEDDGRSWTGGLMLDERAGISYPDLLQAPDGRIFISYDRERARLGEILMARITEADILAGRLTDAGSRLKMKIFRANP